jgi:hypothetical protein
MGDARHAEQLFALPAFDVWRERDDFRKLEQEAKLQARD